MANEHTIRVSARGEFGQLENGLKNLQKDLKSVLGEIDKGARRGGLFDDTQLRALDVYRERFKGSMGDVNREMQKQNDTIDQLHRRRENASRSEQKNIDDEIRRREKALDVLRRQIRMVDDLYARRDKEAKGYGTTGGGAPMGGSASSGGSASGAGGIFGGAMAKVLGMGKFMVGLAGIAGIASMATQSYNLALQSQTTPMNLSQRIRGQGYSGSAKNMWDTIGGVGRSGGMGYTSMESWQFQDQYSRQAGALGASGLEHALKFGRGYGLEVGETAGALGSNRQLGGTSNSQEFANMIAASVSQSGMTPRILEVMEASNGLLEQMNTSLKDGGSKEILAYQTTLDKAGKENGMNRLTGQQGANVIAGLGGIFNPGQDNPWKWMGIQALQQYDPKKYGKKGLYDLETSFEDGLENTDNVAAMGKYLRGKSGGDENTMKRMLQRWLQDGGYNATKQQVNDLYKATDGFTAFDKDKISAVTKDMEKGDGTAKYQERMGQLGQDILDTNARFEKQLENLGQPILVAVQGIKEGVTSLLEELNTQDWGEKVSDALANIKKFMDDNLVGLATAAGLVALAPAIAKLMGGGGKGGGKGSGASKVLPLVGGKGVLSTLLKGFALFGTGKSALDATDMDKQRKWAKEAGLDPKDITYFDALFAEMADFFSFGLFNQKEFYEMFSEKTKKKYTDKMDKFFDTFFPDKPRTKEEKEALENVGKGKTPDGKEKRPLSWYQYANPKNWHLPKEIFGGDTTPAKELAKKYPPQDAKNSDEATDSLVKLGSTGLVNITTLTENGKQNLKTLQEQGVIKISEGQTVSNATLFGFTTKGQAKIAELADKGLISVSGFSENGTAKITALSAKGKSELSKLKEEGTISISSFKDEGVIKITHLSKEGAKQILELQKNGSLSLSSTEKTAKEKLEDMRKKTDTKLGDMLHEHKTFVDKTVKKDGIFQKWSDDVTGIFDKFIQWWKDKLPSWLGGGDSEDGGGGSSGGGGDLSGVNGSGKRLAPAVLAYKSRLEAAGEKYGVGDTDLLMAVMNQESHGAGNNPMQVNGVHDRTTSVNTGTKMLADLLKKTGGNVPEALAAYNMGPGILNYFKKHGGYSVENMKNFSKAHGGHGTGEGNWHGYGDPWYVEHVMQYYPKSSAVEVNSSNDGKSNFFNGWEGRVTSHFGDRHGRSKPHGGLDIDGKQGDHVEALRSGKIAFLKMDDGGKYDADGKKNTRAGGTEIGIKMANGMTYFYSHLSKVNSEILKAYKSGKTVQIKGGDYIGNVGGDPGKAGSGYSTSGSHLHLGYLDKNGNYKNPEPWLESLTDRGDSDMGQWAQQGVQSGTTVKKVEVEVKITGEVEKLNGASEAKLKSIIESVIKNYEAQKLLLNPSV